MSEEAKTADGRDYRDTLLLPQTEFPMRAGLPQREPEILARWERLDIFARMREDAKGREIFVLHDGPPYANGNIHIGTALNKILKDMVVRSQQYLGKDSNYVPGWDCHGLPIEWKIEEQYRAKGRDKDAVPINEFRKECRDFAEHWIDVQREEFKRLGVVGDWARPYTTMSYAAEAQIARELLKFAESGQLYRGSKPVMWSVVEKTALAEAEVEYHDYTSDTIWAKFPIVDAPADLAGASVVIWTTTPWTMPGNRAISYSSRISYGLYEVTAAPEGNWAKAGDRLILADALAGDVMAQAKVDGWERRADVDPAVIRACAHPFRGRGYDFAVPLLEGDHVTEEAGTGFVHTAPGHGADDFEIWAANEPDLVARGIDTAIPFTVDADGLFTQDAPGFEGRAVITADGKKGDANKAVIDALVEAGALIARGRLTHQYPHSWRSKKPIIFRNTPQWFISMDRDIAGPGDTLRARALKAIDDTRFVPQAGHARLRGMIEHRPDWVISRQRAWGVPITVFVNRQTGEILNDPAVNRRIADAFEDEGADAWFADGAAARFLADAVARHEDWEQVRDILDVWFDSGSTHSFVLEPRNDLKWPADVYLEGSDQHRGWFHSSLLESCGTRGRAPYDAVVTHGFTMAEDGRKMSKSLGNQVFPQDVIKQYGADILRLWVASCDYTEDQRIGPEILKANAESYRRLRNTMRFMLGNLQGFDESERIDHADMPELERYILHHVAELDAQVRADYANYDYRRIYSRLFNFATIDLSAFYFDIRKDALYCDPLDSVARRSCRTVLDTLFSTLTAWFAPILCFTMEEVWLSRFPDDEGSVHLRTFPEVPAGWRDEALAARWRKVRTLRRVVTGALEIERRDKRIGSSLEAAPVVHVEGGGYLEAMKDVDLAEIAITSQASLVTSEAPADAFRLDDVPGIAVVPALATGRRCARSWKILPEVGSDPDYPDLSPRDAEAVRRYDARAKRSA
jgi:isoleucyl-tRNA synthetase